MNWIVNCENNIPVAGGSDRLRFSQAIKVVFSLLLLAGTEFQ
jgi:hypothetical protein